MEDKLAIMDHPIYNALDFMENLPVIRDLVICRSISAHDKKGGNDNGFTQKAEFIRRETWRRTVLMDAVGPGCVFYFAGFWLNHIRLTPKFVERIQLWFLGKVNFFFDGEKSPSIRTPLDEFVGQPPFIYPLALKAEESTGTMPSYVPMPFQDGLKVTMDGGKTALFGLHFWYHCYPRGTTVPTWSAGKDIAQLAANFHPETAWKPAGPVIHEVKDISIQPGESREIFRSDRGGTIKCIRMRLPEDDLALRNLWLKAWWDDDEEPSLAGPLSLFFAVENRFAIKKRVINENADMRGVVIGQDKDGFFFLRLPMPYAKRARVVIENCDEGAHRDAPSRIPEVRIESDGRVHPGLGKSSGYLCAQFRESRDLTPGRDYLLAHVKGRGHIAGTVIAVENTHENFLEGDERCYTDGSRTPLILGDATETYFNGSWYFCETAFACPLHGAPTFRMKSKWGGDISDITMYRFHPTDFIPFRSEARFSIQHGGFNEEPGNYRSLVFYYSLPEKSLFRADYLSMDKSSDLAAHDFSGARPLLTLVRDGFFEGEFNGQDLGTKKRPTWIPPIWWMIFLTFIVGNRHKPPKNSPDRVSFTIVEHDAPYEFTVRIDPKADAIMLRRVLDQSVFDQRARIEVDGKLAGIWFNTGNNKWKIFAEDDIILDPSTTKGKDKIRVRIVPESPIFTAAEYTVFSIVAPEPEL